MHIRTTLKQGLRLAFVALTIGVLCAPMSASAATTSDVREAQNILTKLKIPTGPIDGDYGGQTGRGLCTFRLIANMTPSRANLDSNDVLLNKMRTFSKRHGTLSNVPAPTKYGQRTYVLVDKTCQILIYVENGKYVRAIAASTGKKSKPTPDFTRYNLDNTEKGWKCSGKYPDNPDGTCMRQTTGRFATSKSSGNMYNRRLIVGNYFVHGSTSVPTYPASSGCIRIPVADSDWMYDKVGNSSDPRIIVQGSYY